MERIPTRRYVPPVILKRERLADVAAGGSQRVSGITTEPGKGGCFEAPRSGGPATLQKRN